MTGKQARILVVDDTPENIQVLVAALKNDYAIVAATNGAKALDLARRQPGPDLILLDVMMPGMNGYEVCEQLSADPTTAKIPVIFVTALTEAGDEARGLELGAVDYVTKPFNAHLLKARIRNHMELKHYRDDLEAQVVARTQALLAATAEKEKLESELRVARSLQMAMVPAGSARGAGGRYEIAATLEPAKAVGGDLFDYFPLDDGRLCFVVGDVSDKGVPAALFMVKTSTLLRTEAAGRGDAVEILERVNQALCRDNDECMFVTLALGILDLDSGRCSLVSAGHELPVVSSPTTDAQFLPIDGGPALGLNPRAAYSTKEFTMEPGQRLVLYTDGVTEAFDTADAAFGEERLLQTVARTHTGDAAGTSAAIIEDLAAFVGSAPQSDDITVFTLHYLGAGGSA